MDEDNYQPREVDYGLQMQIGDAVAPDNNMQVVPAEQVDPTRGDTNN